VAGAVIGPGGAAGAAPGTDAAPSGSGGGAHGFDARQLVANAAASSSTSGRSRATKPQSIECSSDHEAFAEPVQATSPAIASFSETPTVRISTPAARAATSAADSCSPDISCRSFATRSRVGKPARALAISASAIGPAVNVSVSTSTSRVSGRASTAASSDSAADFVSARSGGPSPSGGASRSARRTASAAPALTMRNIVCGPAAAQFRSSR